MSFTRLDEAEFPTLDAANHINRAKKTTQKDKNKQISTNKANDCDSTSLASKSTSSNEILTSDDFVRCRIGTQLVSYHEEDLPDILDSKSVGHQSDFILAPIAPSHQSPHEQGQFEVISDLVLSSEDWHSKVAIDLGYPRVDYFDPVNLKYFEKLFRHALYLSPSIVVLSTPETDIAQTMLASMLNQCLSEARCTPAVLFRIPMNCSTDYSRPDTWFYPKGSKKSLKSIKNLSNGGATNGLDKRCHRPIDEEFQTKNIEFESSHKMPPMETPSLWEQWDALRSHLDIDSRFGVCLTIQYDVMGSDEELRRWKGEPVRMLVINVDQFIRSPGLNGPLKLNERCKNFIKDVIVSNSLKTSLVVESTANQNLDEYFNCLRNLLIEIQDQHVDYLRNWNDKIQPPLQPLSSNLDSSIYTVFEMDREKYLQYRDAMIEALDHIIKNNSFSPQKRNEFILMVLGAGRGPLVDSFIDAIRAINCQHKFKIYALDKNQSSIRSLKYKQKHQWLDKGDTFEVEVVEADMRSWKPGVKADIIATELLGSLSDNELSPECIDGVWEISTPETISIPQMYSSHIAPICSYKIFQELHKLKCVESHVFDQIYVTKLCNYYPISKPTSLFEFEHRDLSVHPSKRCNQRFKKLSFYSKVNTLCHGFAGYFSAHLFGSTYISTVDGSSTPNMNSWFPAFIPLEQPVPMDKNSRLDFLMWRKESPTKVWYEWAITHPVKSRIYSVGGLKSAMSKFIH